MIQLLEAHVCVLLLSNMQVQEDQIVVGGCAD
jgi:hypothetical protein